MDGAAKKKTTQKYTNPKNLSELFTKDELQNLYNSYIKFNGNF